MKSGQDSEIWSGHTTRKICFLRILCTLSHQETAEDVHLDSSAYINVLAIFLTLLTSKIQRLTASLIEITQRMTHTYDIEINLNDDNVIVTLKFRGTIFTWHVYFKSIHFSNIPCRPKDVHFWKKKSRRKIWWTIWWIMMSLNTCRHTKMKSISCHLDRYCLYFLKIIVFFFWFR